MTQDITTSSPRKVGFPRNAPLRVRGRYEPTNNRARNIILVAIAFGALLALIMSITNGYHKREMVAAKPITAAVTYPQFTVLDRDWWEKHGVTHAQALAMNRFHRMPFMSKQLGHPWTWVSSRDAQYMLVAHNRMISPVCYGDQMDFTPGVMGWHPAFGSTSLKERRRQIESGKRYTCRLPL